MYDFIAQVVSMKSKSIIPSFLHYFSFTCFHTLFFFFPPLHPQISIVINRKYLLQNCAEQGDITYLLSKYSSKTAEAFTYRAFVQKKKRKKKSVGVGGLWTNWTSNHYFILKSIKKNKSIFQPVFQALFKPDTLKLQDGSRMMVAYFHPENCVS